MKQKKKHTKKMKATGQVKPSMNISLSHPSICSTRTYTWVVLFPEDFWTQQDWHYNPRSHEEVFWLLSARIGGILTPNRQLSELKVFFQTLEMTQSLSSSKDLLRGKAQSLQIKILGMLCVCSVSSDSVTPWTVACQSPLPTWYWPSAN